MTKRKGPEARRVTVWQDRRGDWWYHVQAGNWSIIDASEEGLSQKRSVLSRIARRWPGVELVIEEP